MTEETHVETAEVDGVITVTLDRDSKRNAIDERIADALWDAVRALRDRGELSAMVISARGRYFSAGIDLNSRTGRGNGITRETPFAGASFRREYRKHHLLYDEIEACEKPVILAAQGPCLGAGLEMAVSCDFRLASTEATFRLPEVGLGTIAGSGGVSRLTRLCGPHWAKWLAMAGKSVDAATARMIGLVHEVFTPADFEAQVAAFAHELAALPREAVGLSKLAIDTAADTDRGTARHIERLANTTLVMSNEFQNKLQAFSARKKRT